MNLLRPQRVLLYRIAKRRATVRLLAKKKMPANERAALLRVFEDAVRREAVIE